jgi:LemA protein
VAAAGAAAVVVVAVAAASDRAADSAVSAAAPPAEAGLRAAGERRTRAREERMKGGVVILAIVAVLVLIVGGWVVGNYNTLVQKKADVDKAYAEVDNLLQRRNDLIPNLVETVKGIAAQEQTVFGEIANARAAMAGARTPEQKFAAGQQMDTALGRLFVVVENYPQLKSQENFLRLQDELAGTENRLSVGRTRYNDVVRDYNVLVKSFPTNVFAGMFGYTERPFYPVTPGARDLPKVSFPSATLPGTVRDTSLAPAGR